MSRKTMVKKVRGKVTGGSKKRVRAWTKVTYEELESWREARKIPKKKMAEMLGVTNSTYHNWARGIAIATPNTQERIRRLIDSNGQAPVAATVTASPNVSRGAVLAATGKIVESYLQARPADLSVERLLALIREVRGALED